MLIVGINYLRLASFFLLSCFIYLFFKKNVPGKPFCVCVCFKDSGNVLNAEAWVERSHCGGKNQPDLGKSACSVCVCVFESDTHFSLQTLVIQV